VSAGLNTLSVASNRCPDQDPEDGAGAAGAGEETRRQEAAANGKRVRDADEAVRLGSGEKPLKGESRTW
jgi:hypothetical protein